MISPSEISPAFPYIFIFILLFLGAFGPTLPEEIVLIIAGFLISKFELNVLKMFLICLGGIILADNLIYFLGLKLGNALLKLSFFQKVFSIQRQRWVRRLFLRYNFRLFFFGRYLYGLRPAILLFAGLTKIKWFLFFFYNFISAFLNTILWLSLGYFFAPHIEYLIKLVRKGEFYILTVLIILIFYFIIEYWLLKKEIIPKDSFIAKIAAPYKIGSLILITLILIFFSRFIHLKPK